MSRKKSKATKLTSLLIQEEPLQVLPSLAVAIGLNEAIFLQQLHYWLRHSRNERDGKLWVYNTFEEWQGQMPWWSTRTIMRIVDKLRRRGLVETSANYNRVAIDKTLWYTINYDAALKAALPGVDDMTDCHVEHDNLSHSLRQSVMLELPSCHSLDDNLAQPITREYTETTSETTTNDDDDDVRVSPLLIKENSRARADREATRKVDAELLALREAAERMVEETLGARSWDGWDQYRDQLSKDQLRLVCYWCKAVVLRWLSAKSDDPIENPVGLVRHGVDNGIYPGIPPIDQQLVDDYINMLAEDIKEPSINY